MALRRNDSDRPTVREVSPLAAIPGGDFQIRGKGFTRTARPQVTIGDQVAPLIVGSDTFVVARVPDGVTGGLVVHNGENASEPKDVPIGVSLADSLHPVANPAVDAKGNVFTTFSGSRGQKTPVAVYQDRHCRQRHALSDRPHERDRPRVRSHRPAAYLQPL